MLFLVAVTGNLSMYCMSIILCIKISVINVSVSNITITKNS